MAAQQYFGLIVLFVINTINFLDRLSVAAVLSKIKDYYGFSSGEGGLLSTCFLVGYMLTAPVFGYLGDKYSRKWILIGGISFWILTAFSASLIPPSHSFLFFISRMLVGVGEASYSTIAPTIIADLFEPSKRKMALSLFYFAIPIGSGLGYLMGNLALSLGDWRWIFRITPAIGLVATLLLALLKEPVRGQSDGAYSDTSDDSTVIDNLKYLMRIKSYVWATVGFTCCLFAMGALSWWAIEFMGVARGKDYEQTATMIFGGIVCAAGFVGVTLGSGSAQYFRKLDGRSDPFVCSAGIFVAIPFIFFGLFYAKSEPSISWVCLFLAVTALSTNWAVVSDMLLSVTLPNKRAFATAMQILISHALGDAASPFIIGFIRDELAVSFEKTQDKTLADYHAFLYALLTTLIILALGAVTFLYSAKFFVRDVQIAKEEIAKTAIDPYNEEAGPDSAASLTDFARSKE